ncbi:MAG: methyltransferase domain-containing protein [Bacillota bacterium]
MAGKGRERMASPRWSEAESEAFLELGPLFTPWRDEMAAVMVDLIPAEPEEAFVAVDVGAGDAWLSEAVLQRFPRACVIALDGSPAMLDAARRRLAAFGARAEVRPFELDSQRWLRELRGPVRCFLSCLVIHHLDDAGKRRLFGGLRQRLEPGGGLLIADIVRPASRWAWRHAARTWNEDVRQRSLQLTGNLEAYQRLAESDWNWFEHPDDPMDKPGALVDQLTWLREAGFVDRMTPASGSSGR